MSRFLPRPRWSFLGKYVSDALLQSPLRSVLSMLGVAVGIAAVLAVVAIGRGASASLSNQFSSLGANLLAVQAGPALLGTINGSLTTEDVQALTRQIPEIEAASGVIRNTSSLTHGKASVSMLLTGVQPDYLLVRSWRLQAGSGFNAHHVAERSPVVVLGASVAQQIQRANGVPVSIGQWVRLQGVPVQVIGVLEAKGRSPVGKGHDQDDVVLMPLSSMKLRRLAVQGTTATDQVESISIKTRDAAQMRSVENRIEEVVRQRHHIYDSEAATTVSNYADIQRAQQRSQSLMTLVLLAIASISLLSGGVGVMNMLLFSVTERTREIGILSALGFTKGTIRALFLLESLAVCLCGGLLGIALGAVAAWGLAQWAGWPWLMDAVAMGVSFGFTLCVGLLAGWWPAHRAASLQPIEALRHKD